MIVFFFLKVFVGFFFFGKDKIFNIFYVFLKLLLVKKCSLEMFFKVCF